jgi:hypothetical protein
MSWGNKLLVAFLVFGAMIGYLVFRAVNTNFEMVEKDYYKKELRYQTVIDGNNLANTLASPIQITETTDEIIVQIPGDIDSNRISGNIIFYCAYDKTKTEHLKFNWIATGSRISARVLSILETTQ